MNAPEFYEIRVKGHLGSSWSTWFEGLTIRHEDKGETVLSGLMDQAALHGALMKTRDLGLTLLSVKRGEREKRALLPNRIKHTKAKRRFT
jgi:hypothetical protein